MPNLACQLGTALTASPLNGKEGGRGLILSPPVREKNTAKNWQRVFYNNNDKEGKIDEKQSN